jgi:hypothetical protein
MEDYIDLRMIENRLKSGHYMNYFAFNSDVRSVFYKALKFMKDDQDVESVVNNLKKKFKSMSFQLNDIPIKQF